ncbi:hypothetical protein OAH18_03465 [bacterium]|nr:hypothetical protein [bacterium]
MRNFIFVIGVVVGLYAVYDKRNPGSTAAIAEIVKDLAPSDRDFEWPPVVGKKFPDPEFIDQDGNTLRLSDLRGKLLLIEPVGIPCPGCQAFVDSKSRGGFAGVTPQANLPSIEHSAKVYGDFDLNDERIVHVQLLLFGMDLQAPTGADAKAWARHYDQKTVRQQYVLAGNDMLQDSLTRSFIPGFWLVDENFTLLSDSTGHSPLDDLYRVLLPSAGRLLNKAR